MRTSARHFQPSSRALGALALLVALLLPASALGAVVQLPGPRGCLVDRSAPRGKCGTARALRGPAPFLGSRAIALSPDGKNVYVASSRSDAIAIFSRNARTGALTQRKGVAGCIAAKGAAGCATAIALDHPNSVAVSPDGRSVYATALKSDSLAVFRRNRATGALSQARDGSGCIVGHALPSCATGRALVGPDVVTVSPDGENVYVGSFFGNAVALFNRDPSSGTLSQPGGPAGCIAEAPANGCATGIALGAPEGMAISGDGRNVYVATAISNAVVVLARNPSSGGLSQATDGSGCVVASPLSGCTTGMQLSGANAVAVSPDGDDVYVTSLLSNSVTSFTRAASSGALTQKSGTAGCVVFLRAAGCSFGRALRAPEGLAVSPGGTSLYAAAFGSGAIDVFNRSPKSGAVAQEPLRAGCVGRAPDCGGGDMLRGVSSLALSPDGRFLYSAAFKSDAIAVFHRIAPPKRQGK